MKINISLDPIIYFIMFMQIILIVFKLANFGIVASWSWFWVLSPIFFSVSFVCVVLFLSVLLILLFTK